MPDSAISSRLTGSLVVVSAMGKENALGRALALAELAANVVERVFVVAPEDGPLWPAASRWPTPVIRADRVRDLPAESNLRRLAVDLDGEASESKLEDGPGPRGSPSRLQLDLGYRR